LSYFCSSRFFNNYYDCEIFIDKIIALLLLLLLILYIILNNKILRIIQDKPKHYCVAELYKNYNTLTIPELHKLQLLSLVHKYVYSLYCNYQLPVAFANYFSLNNEFHQYFTRSSNHLHLPRVSTPHGSKSIKFKACQLWNTIPEKLKSVNTLNTFKKQQKTYT